jgi:hypothetical protein
VRVLRSDLLLTGTGQLSVELREHLLKFKSPADTWRTGTMRMAHRRWLRVSLKQECASGQFARFAAAHTFATWQATSILAPDEALQPRPFDVSRIVQFEFAVHELDLTARYSRCVTDALNVRRAASGLISSGGPNLTLVDQSWLRSPKQCASVPVCFASPVCC